MIEIFVKDTDYVNPDLDVEIARECKFNTSLNDMTAEECVKLFVKVMRFMTYQDDTIANALRQVALDIDEELDI